MFNKNSEGLISPYLKDFPRFDPKIKLAILASGKGTNFESIAIDIERSKLDAEIICLIVNSHNCEAIERATKLSIPYYVLNHKDFESREDLDKAIIKICRINYIEAIVMVGWMRIVTNILIKEFKGRIVNLHPSLLPSFKGNKAIRQAITNKVKITGCTVHIVEEDIDSGEIIIQSAIHVDDSDNEMTLHSKIQKQEHKIISMGIALAAMKWRRNN